MVKMPKDMSGRVRDEVVELVVRKVPDYSGDKDTRDVNHLMAKGKRDKSKSSIVIETIGGDILIRASVYEDTWQPKHQ